MSIKLKCAVPTPVTAKFARCFFTRSGFVEGRAMEEGKLYWFVSVPKRGKHGFRDVQVRSVTTAHALFRLALTAVRSMCAAGARGEVQLGHVFALPVARLTHRYEVSCSSFFPAVHVVVLFGRTRGLAPVDCTSDALPLSRRRAMK